MNIALPKDEQTAIQITPLSFHTPSLSEEPIHHEEYQIIKKVNSVLSHLLSNPNFLIGDRLLMILKECFQYFYAKFIIRHPHEEEIILSEYCDTTREQEDSNQTNTFSFALPDGIKYFLEVNYPNDNKTDCFQEYCKFILTLFLMCHHHQLNKQIQSTDVPHAPQSFSPWNELIGNQIKAHLSRYTDLCQHSDTVLIIGKTGTGKELVARSLHQLWKKKGEFIAINCAAIPSDLLESELFGVTKGAATGVSAREGYISKARDGTLFLDEISEMALPLQSKLLRFIQEREYYNVGSAQAQKADIHIVASTNQSPILLLSGLMRKDLYFRLSQTVITLPPLKDRLDDIASLCQFFLNKLELQLNKGVKGLSVSALDRLKKYDWPGNVRELQHVLRFLYINAPKGGLIQSVHMPEEFQKIDDIPESGSLASIIKSVEKKVILRELEKFKNVGYAAKVLGLSEGYLYRKIKQLGIRWKQQT